MRSAKPRVVESMTEYILGHAISTRSKRGCISEIAGLIRNKEKGRYFVCANPHSLEVAHTDAHFSEAIKGAALTVPDGIGIVLASRILGGTIRERVTGSDIFLGLSSLLNHDRGYRYFFLGSTEETLLKIREKMGTAFPNIRIVGTYSPPFSIDFSDEENRLMVKAVNRSEPDVLWVGMTAPKQEKWVYRNRAVLDVSFIGPVGAAFDFFAGTVKRAHPLFQKTGLEWLPRLLREPRRLWRRNLVSNPSFLARVMVSRLVVHGGGEELESSMENLSGR